MQRSVVSAVAFALLCVFQCSSVLAAGIEPGCTSGECLDIGFEETALVQTKLQAHRRQAQLEHTKQLPSSSWFNLSNLTDAITNVTDAITDTATSAILDVVAKVKSQLEALDDDIQPYLKLENETSAVLEEGLAGILAEAFGVTIDGIPEESKEKAANLIEEADSIWTMIVQAIQAASSSVDSLLSLLGSSADDIRTQVNTTMQGVLSTAEGVLEAFDTVDEAISEVLNTTKASASNKSEVASLLQANQTKLDRSDLLSDRSDLLDTVNKAVAEAVQAVSGFADGFSSLFGSIEDDIESAMTAALGSDDVKQVTDAIEDLEATATEIANEVVGSTKELLSSVTDATAEVAATVAAVKGGAVGQPLARWGLGLAAAAVFAAVGV